MVIVVVFVCIICGFSEIGVINDFECKSVFFWVENLFLGLINIVYFWEVLVDLNVVKVLWVGRVCLLVLFYFLLGLFFVLL